jgi:RNA polymerase sigma-70 factor (ECF subfamily)
MLMTMTRPTPADDGPVLMARVAEGDRVAFKALAVRLHGPALRLATRVLSDRAEAEDAVQAALVKLWANASRYEAGRGSVEGWFRRLLVNCCLDRRRTIRPAAPLDAVAEASSDMPNPHETAEGAERAARVNAAVEALLPRQRAAIALFYGDGASMAEIAAMLETTPKAVEGLLARARTELAGRLSGLREV